MRLKEKDIEVSYLYLTTKNEYRAVLAMKGEFMIYAPSLEGAEPLNQAEVIAQCNAKSAIAALLAE